MKTKYNSKLEKIKQYTEDLIKVNIEISGLPESLVRSCDNLAFEQALGINPLKMTIEETTKYNKYIKC